MGLNLKHLPPDVAARLREFYRRKLAFCAARAACIAALFYAFTIVIATHADRFIFLSTDARLSILHAVHGVTALVALVSVFWVFRKRESPRSIAYQLEIAIGAQSREELVTLESVLARPGESGAIAADLIQHLETSTLKISRGYHAGKFVHDPIAKRLGFSVAGVALILALLMLVGGYQFRLMLERFYFPARNLPRPSFIKLDVTANNAILGKGTEAVIQAHVVDETPALLAWFTHAFNSSPLQCDITITPWNGEKNTANPAGGEVIKMIRVSRDLYLFTKADLRDGFRYQVRCGNAQTPLEQIAVAAQPRVLDLRVTTKSPTYANLPDATLTDLSRPILLLAGTNVEISFRADQPVERVLLHAEKAEKPISPEWDAKTLTAHYTFVLKEPVAYEIELANSLGFNNIERAVVRIGILEDAAPTVRLNQPPQEVEAIAGSLVEFRGQAEDDFGLAELALRYVLNPDPKSEPIPREITIPLSMPSVKQAEVAATLDLEKADAIPGDTLAAEVRVRDTHGTDGVSHGVLIHVMPFTRGADEQHRLAALKVVGQIFALMASPKIADSESQSPMLKLDADGYAAIVKTAHDTGVELGEEPSCQSMFDLLESEHYLTADPRHQGDLRMLSAVLLSDTGPLALDAPNGRAALLKADLPVLERVRNSLLLHRRTRNLLWRLTGMGDEARRIRDMLGELAAVEKPSADAMQRVDRRGSLYLAALQDIGTELIELSKADTKIDAVTASQIVGDLNETGYLLSKGALARRKSAANRIGAQITAALDLTREAMPALVMRDAEARRELTSLYTSKFLALASPRGDTERWRDAAYQWLAWDRLALEREPFAPFWPRVVDFSIGRMLRTGSLVNLPALIKLAEESPALIEERAIADRLALAWRIQTIARSSNTSEAERTMESSIVTSEALANTRDPIAKSTGLSQRETARQVAQLTEKWLGADDPSATLDGCQKNAESVAHILTSLDESLSGGAPTDLSKDVTTLLAALRTEATIMQSAIDSLTIRILRLPGSDGGDDAMVLRLKDQIARFDQRARSSITSLRATAESPVSSSSLGELKSQVSRLRVLHESMRKGIVKLASAEGGPSDTADTSLEHSASLARAALSGGEARTPAAIRTMLAKMKGGTSAVLSARADAILDARRAADEASHALEGATPDAAKIRASITRARDCLATFSQSASRLGTTDIPASVVSRLADATAESQQLPPIQDSLAAADVTRLRFSLNSWARKLGDLSIAVRTASGSDDDTGPDFLGGPERAWAVRSGYEAQAVRSRLKAIARMADTLVIDGLLSSLDEKPGQAGIDPAYAWAALRFRLDRSELAGVGVKRSLPKTASKVSDPLLEYLKSELGEAKQQQKIQTEFSETTRAYLDLIGDYLQY